jgi:hypothetical protein
MLAARPHSKATGWGEDSTGLPCWHESGQATWLGTGESHILRRFRTASPCLSPGLMPGVPRWVREWEECGLCWVVRGGRLPGEGGGWGQQPEGCTSRVGG